ncbi:MAG: hypothetical protein UU07_C0047G0013, partial [Parcubacteria group bacterium GW2011_GWF1_40_5]
MYIIIDFIDNAFHLRESEFIPNMRNFYDFYRSMQIENLDNIVKIINLSFSHCCVLLLYGYI